MAKKTSFEQADSQRRTLAELISEAESSGGIPADDDAGGPEGVQADEQEDTPVDTEPTTGDSDERLDASDSQSTEATGEHRQEADSGSEAQDVKPSPALAKLLRDRGYDVDEQIGEDDLYRSVIDRIADSDRIRKESEQARQERDKLVQELESLRKAAPATETKPEQNLLQEVVDELWGSLPTVDQNKLRMVDQDPKTGMFRTKEEYKGIGGESAADELNQYNSKINRRSDEILRDPTGVLLKTGLRERIREEIATQAERIVDEKLKSLGDLKSQTISAFEKKQAVASKQQRVDQFWADKSAQLIKINATGEPILDLDRKPISTELGREFYRELHELRELGIKDEEVLLQKAWKTATAYVKPVAKATEPVVEATVAPVVAKPAAVVKDSGEDKRKRFVERRTNDAPMPPDSREGFVERTPGSRNKFAPRKTLLELVNEDPHARELMGN